MFTSVVILCYFSSGIATAVFAGGWGGPPEVCPDPDSDIGDICDSVPLTAINALQCVSIHYCRPCKFDSHLLFRCSEHT